MGWQLGEINITSEKTKQKKKQQIRKTEQQHKG